MAMFRGLAAGAAGGLAGAAVMGLSYAVVAKLMRQSPPNGDDATEKVADAVSTQLIGQRLDATPKKTGGQIVHFTFGTSMGALYGMSASAFPAVTTGAGSFFGLAMYVGAHSLVVPALGLAPSPLKNSPAQEAPEFVAHLVYGIVAETVRRLLS